MAAIGDLTLDGRASRRQVTRAGSTASYDVLSLDNTHLQRSVASGSSGPPYTCNRQVGRTAAGRHEVRATHPSSARPRGPEASIPGRTHRPTWSPERHQRPSAAICSDGLVWTIICVTATITSKGPKRPDIGRPYEPETRSTGRFHRLI